MRFIKIKGFSLLNNHLVDYPTPTVGYISSFGALSGLCLIIQIITGVLLAAHYTPHILYAFNSIEHIIRNVNDGWVFRYYHMNGASVFFICLYCHIYFNYSTEGDDLLWLSGLVLYVLVIATAFIGYILPWGQISFWGATVITNLFAAIPYIGVDISQWLWGGFSVDNPTLNRFFSFHYILPFIILIIIIIHLTLLHLDESSSEDNEYIEFYYYYYSKDLFAFFILMIILSILVFFNPDILSHPDNYIIASISVTPSHLVPEWYFLPFYAVLRSTPDKFGGLLLIFIILIDIFFVDLILDQKINNFLFTDVFDFQNNIIDLIDGDIEEDDDIGLLIILLFLGGRDIDEPYTDLASLLILFQFFDYFDFNIDNKTEFDS